MSFNPQPEQGHLDQLDQQVASSNPSSLLSGTPSNFPGNDCCSPARQNSHKNAAGVESIPSSHPAITTPQPVDLSATPCRATQLLTSPLLPSPASPIYLTLNSAGIVLSVNPAGATSLGFSAEDLIGQSVMNLFHPLDRVRLQTELLILPAAPPVKQGEFRLISHEGRTVEQIVMIQTFQTAEQVGALLICTPCDSPTAQKIYRLEQAQAEQVLRQQTEWERLMGSIAQPTDQSLELRLILEAIAAEVRQLLQADRVLFYQMYSAETGSILAESLGPGCSSIADAGDAVFQQIFQQKCVQLQKTAATNSAPQQSLPVLEADVRKPAAYAKPRGVQAEVILPIIQQEALWGLLVVHQCQRSRQWQLWELGLLKQLVVYLNSVIQQAELYQKVQCLNAELERQIQTRTAELQQAFDFEATLKRITDSVRDSLDENEILETVVQELARAIGCNGCNASIYDLEAGTSTICYEYTAILSAYQGRVVQLDAFPEIYTQLLEGQSFQFCSLNINPTRGKVSMLTCPIVDDQDVLGDLWLINYPYYCFTEQDIRLVQQVANQCAITIRQARLYQAAQAQVRELERLNQLKDDFLSTVSHELRTPMANIKMATQMLEVVLKQAGFLLQGNNFRASKYFQILQTECQREINLINDLLDLSRLDTEQTLLQPNPIDLPTWLTTIVQPFLTRTHEQQQQLQLDYSPHLPILTTDRLSLERIVTELLQNACKYTPSGETITVSAKLKLVEEAEGRGQKAEGRSELISTPPSPPSPPSTHPPIHPSTHPPTLLLSITNSGVEIPPLELSCVFEKFYRIPNNDPWQHGGTGLGLALVKKLAERLGGTIWAESRAGQTCFTVELPLV